MAGFNRVILIGNLTRDPELRYTPQGTPVTDLSLAVNTVRGGRGTEKKEEVLFIDCTVWDRQAETCCEYLKKGRPVLVEGRLVDDRWQDKETGEKRSRTKVLVASVQFLGSGGRDREDGGAPSSSSSSRRTAPPSRRESGGGGSGADDDFGPSPGGDDIPF